MPKLIRTKTGNLLGTPYKFKNMASRASKSVSFSECASCIDDICVIRSMWPTHHINGGVLADDTGEQAFSRPCIGSWLLYGLGVKSESSGFVVLSPSQPAQGAPLWSASFLPAAIRELLFPISTIPSPI